MSAPHDYRPAQYSSCCSRSAERTENRARGSSIALEELMTVSRGAKTRWPEYCELEPLFGSRGEPNRSPGTMRFRFQGDVGHVGGEVPSKYRRDLRRRRS